jgi:hypothetical protein
MKKIYIAVLLLIALGGCKSNFSIAMSPDKSSFGSGTIGSVKATNYLPGPDSGAINPWDSSLIKNDTAHREFHLIN